MHLKEQRHVLNWCTQDQSSLGQLIKYLHSTTVRVVRTPCRCHASKSLQTGLFRTTLTVPHRVNQTHPKNRLLVIATVSAEHFSTQTAVMLHIPRTRGDHMHEWLYIDVSAISPVGEGNQTEIHMNYCCKMGTGSTQQLHDFFEIAFTSTALSP